MRMKKKELLFYVSFIFYFVSLFMGDVAPISFMPTIAKLLRVIAYMFLALGLVNIQFLKLNVRKKIIIILCFCIALLFVVYSKEIYWCVLLLFITESNRVKPKDVLKISYIIILIGSVITVLLCLIGVLPDVLTIRDGFRGIQPYRHSLGFYHSNVLPLLVLYLESYYVLISHKKINSLVVILFLLISFILFVLCNSRNAFGLSIILSIAVLTRKSKIWVKLNNPLYYITKYSVAGMSTFSLAMIFLIEKGGIWDKVDTIFSGRFRLAVFKTRRIGIHVFNFMSNEDFFNDSIFYANGQKLDTVVLDNGYIYIMLRYGLAVILFYCFISFLLAYKERNNSICLISILVVFICNFVDNDLVDYSFMPLIIYAFAQYDFKEKLITINMKYRNRSNKWLKIRMT